MPDLRKVGIVSIAAFAAQLILNKGLYPLIGTQQTQTLFSIDASAITPASGIGGTQLGDKLLGYMTGYIPFDISNYSIWIAMLIGIFALTYAGFWLYEQKYIKLWQGKNMSSRLFAVLLYGHIVLYLALLLLKWNVPGISTSLLFGLGLNLLLVSMIVTLSEKYFKWPKF